MIKRVRYVLMILAVISVFTVAAGVSAGGVAYNYSNYSWFVVWACCGQPQQSGWYGPGSSSLALTGDGDFFGTSVTNDVYWLGVLWLTVSPYQTFKMNDVQWGYHYGNTSQRPWTNVY